MSSRHIMDSKRRLRPCARPACDARRAQSSTGSCCDETCLEAIARASMTPMADRPSDEGEAVLRTGIQRSLAQWKAALERAECLCAEMLKMGLQSCCVTQGAEVPPMRGQILADSEKCCSTASLESGNALTPDPTTGGQGSCSSIASGSDAGNLSSPAVERDCSSAPGPKTCCSRAKTDCSSTPGPKPCCPPAKIECSVTPGPKTCCPGAKTDCSPTLGPKACCSSATSTMTVQATTPPISKPSDDDQLLGGRQSLMPDAIDLEKGSVMEHAVVQISGMTCTGCERKLQRVLSSIPGVHNVQTSLVAGRAEFDVVSGLSVNEVASLLERQTEFKCIIYQRGHQLEVLIPGRPSTRAPATGATAVISEKGSALLLYGLAGPNYPPGVEDVKIIDSKGREWKSRTADGGCLKMFAAKPQQYSARISYNPRVVGARDLLEKGFGAPLALAPLGSDRMTATDTDDLRRTLYLTLGSAVLTIPVLITAWAPLPPHKNAYGSVSLALATLVQFIIAGPFYPQALKTLVFSGIVETDLLIVISTTTAYVYSVVAFVYEVLDKPLSTGGFFETSTLLVTLIRCGRLASAFARRKAADSISFQALQPPTALLSEDGNARLIDVREFQYGDSFKVLPDSIIPTDGTIVSGETEIDESVITGEAVLVPKFPGSQIVAGSVNGSAPFTAQLTNLPIDNTISRIANMVEEAKLSKPKLQATVDRVASYFVPSILAVTVVVFSVWIAVGIAARHASTSEATVAAITYALAALIVSCPCAIGLAVPMVMVIAGGVGAKQGVIVKSPEAIENARKASHVIFDKTGTLTQGKLVVVEEVYREKNRNRAASIAYQLTVNSSHPVSLALKTYLESLGTGPVKLESVSSAVGKGVHAILEGQVVRGGNPLYVDVVEDLDVQRLLSQGLTVFCLRHGSALLAIYGLRDALRTDTEHVVSRLQARGIVVSIVSGDSIIVVNKLASELGIPLSHAKGQCTPEDKARYISSLFTAPSRSKTERSVATTIFCGDGSNDAVALAQADIGVHMAGGTDVAKSAADVVLTRPSLAGILALIDLSRASMHRVYLNFAWSFVYNLFAILLAAGAFVKARIPPAYAGLGELVSVLPVIMVAMHVRWMKFH